MTSPFAPLLPAAPGDVRADSAALAPLWERRAEARAASSERALPSADEEAWRYSPINDLDLAAFEPPADASGAPEPAALRAGALPLGDDVLVLDVVDGVLRRPGIVVVDLAALHAGGGDTDAEPDPQMLADVVSRPLVDAFASFAAAAAPTTIVLVVPPGAVISRPTVLRHVLTQPGVAAASNVIVLAGVSSEATIVEWHDGGAGGQLVVPLVEVAVAAAARLRFVQVQDHPRSVTQIGNLAATVGRDATFELFHAGLGGGYVRQRTDCRLADKGATGNLSALFYGDGDQVLDFRTFQIHDAPYTTSNLLFTGAVGGRAKSVYTGLIRIEKDAKASNAFQTNRNLKLSDDAWADSVPNLEIENNDVRCSHASTVSPVDPDQLFYLESRGVPTQIAERLIVEGFFDEVLQQFPLTSLGSEVGRRIAARLDAGGAA